MSLIDDVIITVKAGNGGNGGTATKQLFGTKKTAPDGGNGGNGGNVYVKGDTNISDLAQFRYMKEIKAENGVRGLNKDLDGANGEPATFLVPYGTTIRDIDTDEIIEILTDEPFCVAYGGHGGMGNHDYNPSMSKMTGRQVEGEAGEIRKLHLILHMIADIGLVGKPNAGKSSLLKKLTNAVPKIGDYPFTTTEPNLGALGKIILADIPGLILGASQGKGLGHQFLKHIQKTKILFHCISSTEENVLETYKTVRDEFAEFDPTLLEKQEILIITKKDLVDDNRLSEIKKELTPLKKKIFAISIYEEETIKSLSEMTQALFQG